MASFKEPTGSRPVSQHRPSSSTTPMNVPGRSGGARSHGHSLSLGTLNSSHRVTRRKSMTSNNFAAVAAAVKGMDDASLEALVSPESRSLASRQGNSMRRTDSSSTAKPGASVPGSFAAPHYAGGEAPAGHDIKEEVDGTQSRTAGDTSSSSSKSRNRRASEGAYLSKDGGKRASAELRCDKCGKGYKHSSCLTKHLWEHTPEWQYTSKLLISKHQQVQLLEAASVLVNMNQDAASSEHLPAMESDDSSASPDASGFSEVQDDDVSSVETTPPPMHEHNVDAKRFSSNSSVFSRSYQSVPGTSIAASSVPSSSYGSFHARRPSSSGTAYSTLQLDDEAGLAAAVKLCNFGTPRSTAIQMDDVPPVPPLPARYASHKPSKSIGATSMHMHNDIMPQGPVQRLSDERDVHMTDKKMDDDDEYDRRSVSRPRSDDHEEGFFGHMEE